MTLDNITVDTIDNLPSNLGSHDSMLQDIQLGNAEKKAHEMIRKGKSEGHQILNSIKQKRSDMSNSKLSKDVFGFDVLDTFKKLKGGDTSWLKSLAAAVAVMLMATVSLFLNVGQMRRDIDKIEKNNIFSGSSSFNLLSSNEAEKRQDFKRTLNRAMLSSEALLNNGEGDEEDRKAAAEFLTANAAQFAQIRTARLNINQEKIQKKQLN